jgi:hypothetical protein
MNLREQLRHLLPEILPGRSCRGHQGHRAHSSRASSPRRRLQRCHAALSLLHPQLRSHLAHREGGSGARATTAVRKKTAGLNGVTRPSLFDEEGDSDQCWSRFLRMVAIYERLSLQRSRYPFLLNRNSSGAPSMEGRVGTSPTSSSPTGISTPAATTPRVLMPPCSISAATSAVPEVGITGVQLKLSVSLETFSADFFPGPQRHPAGRCRARLSSPKV